jgi:hypothetical protein
VALTDANGKFSDLRVRIPTDADTGWHVIRAQGRTTNAIATTCYNVIPGRLIHDARQEEPAWGEGGMSDAGW